MPFSAFDSGFATKMRFAFDSWSQTVDLPRQGAALARRIQQQRRKIDRREAAAGRT